MPKKVNKEQIWSTWRPQAQQVLPRSNEFVWQQTTMWKSGRTWVDCKDLAFFAQLDTSVDLSRKSGREWRLVFFLSGALDDVLGWTTPCSDGSILSSRVSSHDISPDSTLCTQAKNRSNMTEAELAGTGQKINVAMDTESHHCSFSRKLLQ